MGKIGIVENGLKKRRPKKRRNLMAVAKAKNPARRSVSLTSAKSVLAKNGLKAVSLKAVANGKKRRKHKKRRNGLMTLPARRNGFFGNSKNDAKQVGFLGAGALGTKFISRALSGFVAPILSRIGVGQYTEILTDLGVAIFVAPFVGQKIGGTEGAKMMRLGGLFTVGLDVVEMFAPNVLSFSPINSAPIVMTGAGAAVSPQAVAQIAHEVETGQTSAAKVAGVMRSLDTAGAQSINTGMYVGEDVSDAEMLVV